MDLPSCILSVKGIGTRRQTLTTMRLASSSRVPSGSWVTSFRALWASAQSARLRISARACLGRCSGSTAPQCCCTCSHTAIWSRKAG